MGTSGLDLTIVVLSVASVHMCTCSALSSAVIDVMLTSIHDDDLMEWVNRWHIKVLLALPLAKFLMGCLCYLLMVVLFSWRELEEYTTSKWICAALGIGGIATAIGTTCFVYYDMYYDGRGSKTRSFETRG